MIKQYKEFITEQEAWSNKSDYRILLDDSPLRPLELVAAISLAFVLIAVSFL